MNLTPGEKLVVFVVLVVAAVLGLVAWASYGYGYHKGLDDGWFIGYNDCEDLYWDLMDEMADYKDECLLELCEYKEMAWCPPKSNTTQECIHWEYGTQYKDSNGNLAGDFITCLEWENSS